MLQTPSTFFRSLKTQPTALVPPIIIVLSTSILWLLANGAAQRTLPDLPVTDWYNYQPYPLLQVLIAMLFVWTFNSFLLKYLSGLETRTAWIVAGWIKLPFLLATAGAFLLSLAFPVQEVLTPVPTEARALSIWLASYWSTVEQSQFSQLTHYLFFGAGLWSLRLLFVALQTLEATRLYLTLVVFAVPTLL